MTSLFLTVIITAFVVSALCGGIVRRARREADKDHASSIENAHALGVVLGDLQNAQEDNAALTKERRQLVGFVASLTNENAGLRAHHAEMTRARDYSERLRGGLIAAGDTLAEAAQHVYAASGGGVRAVPLHAVESARGQWANVRHCQPALCAPPPAETLGAKAKEVA